MVENYLMNELSVKHAMINAAWSAKTAEGNDSTGVNKMMAIEMIELLSPLIGGWLPMLAYRDDLSKVQV